MHHYGKEMKAVLEKLDEILLSRSIKKLYENSYDSSIRDDLFSLYEIQVDNIREQMKTGIYLTESRKIDIDIKFDEYINNINNLYYKINQQKDIAELHKSINQILDIANQAASLISK